MRRSTIFDVGCGVGGATFVLPRILITPAALRIFRSSNNTSSMTPALRGVTTIAQPTCPSRYDPSRTPRRKRHFVQFFNSSRFFSP